MPAHFKSTTLSAGHFGATHFGGEIGEIIIEALRKFVYRVHRSSLLRSKKRFAP